MPQVRDSLTVMDSCFRGSDVMIEREPSLPPATTVTPAVSVIPAQAGIHRPIQGVMNPETRVIREGSPAADAWPAAQAGEERSAQEPLP